MKNRIIDIMRLNQEGEFVKKNDKLKNTSKISLRKAMLINNIPNIVVTIIFGILLKSTDIYIAFFLKNAIDSVTNKNFAEMKNQIVLVCIVTVAFLLLGIIGRKALSKSIKTAMFNYKNAVIDSFMKKCIKNYNGKNTGNYVSIMSNDINIIREDYVKSIFYIINMIFLLVATIVAMVYVEWIMLIVVIVVSVIPLVIGLIFGNIIKKKQSLVSEVNETYTAFIKDMFMGFSVIKSFNVEEEISNSHKKINKKVEKNIFKHFYTTQISSIGVATGAYITMIGIFGVGGYLVGIDRMSIGSLLAIVQLTNYIIGPVQNIIDYSNKIVGAKSILDKIDNTVLYDEEGLENTCIGEANKESFDEIISVKDVTFGYDEEKTVLNNVSTSFEKNKSYAIVGGSGSGKSTLLKLLLGYYSDYKGNISMDGIEINNIDKTCLYELMSVVSQDVFMFDDSIKNNISLYKDYTDEDINNAINMAGMREFIESKGIDYRCGENGILLSGGQSQRVSIARALIKKTPILMMDEAMAALDYETASKLETQLQNINNLTRIVVTHNISKEVLQGYDKIIMMKKGKIVEEGTYEELMDKKGNFYSLVMLEG